MDKVRSGEDRNSFGAIAKDGTLINFLILGKEVKARCGFESALAVKNFAILSTEQGKGYGPLSMQWLLQKDLEEKAKHLYVKVVREASHDGKQKDTCSFFEKYGFQTKALSREGFYQSSPSKREHHLIVSTQTLSDTINELNKMKTRQHN